MFIISGIVCFNSLINESILVGNVHQFIVNVPWMQRSGLGSELDIDCLVATLCLGTMISWLHYVRCVVWLQMKIITGLAKLSGNKSCPPPLLTNSAGCRHCEASLKPISLTFRMFLFFSDFYDRRHNWFHNTIDKSQVTKPSPGCYNTQDSDPVSVSTLCWWSDILAKLGISCTMDEQLNLTIFI